MGFFAEALVYIQSHVDSGISFENWIQNSVTPGISSVSAASKKGVLGFMSKSAASVLPRPMSYVDEDMIKSYRKSSTSLLLFYSMRKLIAVKYLEVSQMRVIRSVIPVNQLDWFYKNRMARRKEDTPDLPQIVLDPCTLPWNCGCSSMSSWQFDIFANWWCGNSTGEDARIKEN